MPVAVFVVEGHDLEFYPDAESAALEIEGYDATSNIVESSYDSFRVLALARRGE